MAQPKLKDMTADEFLVWCLTQDERYEFVDGAIVPLRAMAGASTAHDRIVSNIIVGIGGQLRGSGCWATTPETALRTSIKRIRRPDVTVECAPPDQRSYEVRNPVATFEVLSPSTHKTDKIIKLPEYMRRQSVRTIVFVQPDEMEVMIWNREDNGEWEGKALRLPEDEIVLDGTAAKMTLAEIYEGVPFAEHTS